MSVFVALPLFNANDSGATLVRWLVTPGSWVDANQPVALFETTKAAVEVVAPVAGFLVALAATGQMVEVGSHFAEIVENSSTGSNAVAGTRSERKITAKADRLMKEHGITASQLPATLELVREKDVLELLSVQQPQVPHEDFDAIFARADYKQLIDLMSALRRRMKQKYNRHVPSGTLLHDRWALAESYGFGEKTSVYDECLILGDVSIGENCWVGPYTVLDGSGGKLSIGDWTSIGTGAHVYTHHTIDNAITGGKTQPFRAATAIGRCCFIAPSAIVAPGTQIGDHSFVAAFSYVEGQFPANSYIAGCPARITGQIKIEDGRVIKTVNKV